MKALCLKLLLLITVLVLSSGDIFAQVTWTKYPGNPVMSGSGNGTWDKHVFMPNVLFNADSNRYEMWYCGSYGPEVAWYPYRIGRAYSSDGINWTKYAGNPVLVPNVGSWDEGSVALGSVLRENGQYKLWYYGIHNNIHQVGYATSPDGITWTKNANPVLSAGSAAWEAGGVLWCSVLSNSGEYTMYYTGKEITADIYRIGRATSVDGINWQRDTINNPILSIGVSGQWDDKAVCGPYCLYTSSMIYVWYTGWANVYTGATIGLATSIDNGNTWIKYANNPVINKGPSGSWDASYVEAGNVMLLQDSVHMWYDGSRENTATNLWRIGLATSPLVLVPVELTSFTATTNGKEVILNWSTATELNNQGFEIQRSTEGKEFFTVGFVNGHGTTTEQQNYSYADRNLDDGKYFYRLKQVDYDGSYEYSDVVEVEWRAFNSYLLAQNFPNPFNPVTTIKYSVPEMSKVTLTLFNLLGEEVATLVNEEKVAGNYSVVFNAASLPSGIYFYRIQAGSFVETKKMILMK